MSSHTPSDTENKNVEKLLFLLYKPINVVETLSLALSLSLGSFIVAISGLSSPAWVEH